VSGAAAIRNAVFHATGVAINRIPLTPHVLFEEFRKAGLLEECCRRGKSNTGTRPSA
jgi:xanthine dehydrogenase molybdenum-binding subunit